MIDNALILIVFMYALSFGLLTVQYVMLDTLGMTMTSMSGEEIPTALLASLNVDRLDTIGRDAATTPGGLVEEDPVLAAAAIAWDILQILTGTYVFSIMLLFDVPSIFVSAAVLLYTFLMARTLIAYLRGI